MMQSFAHQRTGPLRLSRSGLGTSITAVNCRRPLNGRPAAVIAASGAIRACVSTCHLHGLQQPCKSLSTVSPTNRKGTVILHARRKDAEQVVDEAEAEEYEEGEYEDEDEDMEDEEEEDEGEMEEIDVLNSYFSIPGMIAFTPGLNDLPRVFLKHPYNESAVEIYLHGAAVTQWLRPNGTDGLALRADADYSGEGPIDSGVKLCFPQYREGSMPENGFANRMPWEVVAAGLDFLPLADGFSTMQPEYEVAAAGDEGDEEAAGTSDGSSAGSGEAVGGEAPQSEAASTAAAAEEEGGPAEGEEGEGAVDEVEEEEEDEEPLARQLKEMYKTVPLEKDLDEYALLIKRHMDAGLDPAPYVTLRLQDTEETREMWPHKFDLLYKITLMEEDDIEELTPSPDSETFNLEISGTRIMQTMVEKQRVLREVEEEGVPFEQDPEQAALGLRRGSELQPSLISEEEEHSVGVGDDVDNREPGLDDRDEEDDELEEVAMQLRLQLRLVNKDPEGSEPMTFQVAQLAHFATKDMLTHGDFIKVRGLGGSSAIDYTSDERRPTLTLFDEDYITFQGQRIDTTFVSAADADVVICPGDRSHFELIPRSGFKDMMVYHPGTMRGAVSEDADVARCWAAVGTGRVSIPEKRGVEREFVLRFHDRYWKEPVWGEEGMTPIDSIPTSMLEQDDQQEDTFDGEQNYGGVGGLGEGAEASEVA